jgi:hypothetical protein
MNCSVESSSAKTEIEGIDNPRVNFACGRCAEIDRTLSRSTAHDPPTTRLSRRLGQKTIRAEVRNSFPVARRIRDMRRWATTDHKVLSSSFAGQLSSHLAPIRSSFGRSDISVYGVTHFVTSGDTTALVWPVPRRRTSMPIRFPGGSRRLRSSAAAGQIAPTKPGFRGVPYRAHFAARAPASTRSDGFAHP